MHWTRQSAKVADSEKVFIYAHKKAKRTRRSVLLSNLAEWTGLEPATPGVTGRYSNQLNYHS
jgi:hypothetical protein